VGSVGKAVMGSKEVTLPVVRAFFDETGASSSKTVTYIVCCPVTKECACIDPVWDFDSASGSFTTESAKAVVSYISAGGLNLTHILETHAHADHITGAQVLKGHTGAKVGAGAGIAGVQKTFKDKFNLETLKPDGSQFDILFKDGDKFKVGKLEITVLAAPGHTPDSVAYYVSNDSIFVGDTMFMPDTGTARCDFPGGSAADLYKTCRRILSLPDSTRMFCCHDYGKGGRKFSWETTVKEQRESNIHVRDGISEEEFVKMRTERDATLSVPRLLLPSVQVNINAGHVFKDSNNSPMLKIPVTTSMAL